MRVLKFIGLIILGLGRQAWSFPRSVTFAIDRRRQRIVRDELEAERLDRIRNPSKYQGK